MRILLFNYEYPPLGGGAANATQYLLKEYAKKSDIEIDVVTSAIDNQESVEQLAQNIRIYRVAIGKKENTLHHQTIFNLIMYSVKGYQKASFLAKENQYSGAHAFFGIPCGAMALLLKKRFGIPYIVSLRGSDVPGYSERFWFLYPLLRPIIKYIWKEAHRVIANSEGLKDLALKTNTQQAIEVIPNGVDTSKFFPRVALRPAKEVIVTVGATRITERKGIKHLLEAMYILRDEYPELRAEFMGDGSAKEELIRYTQAQGLTEKVTFLGRIQSDKTPQYYQRASIFVLPSYNEGMSNALLEALATGLPLIVTNTGGSHELVTENQNGLYIEKKSAESIAVALRRILANPDLAKQFSKESRKRAETRSWGFVAEKYHQCYEQMSLV